MDNCIVSIIMPVYNGAMYLQEAIESVLHQSFKDYEFIIADDASTDSSLNIIQTYSISDKRIRLVKNETNIGIVRTLNKCLKLSKGKYLARIDSDDIWHKQKLEKQISYLIHHKNTFLLGTFKSNIELSGSIVPDKTQKYITYPDIKKNLLKYNLFCHSSVVFRRSIIEEVGLYNENYKNSEDYEMWIRISAARKVEILGEILTYYRIHYNMVSLRKRKQQFKYAIKAKFDGVQKHGYPFYMLIFILKDLWPLLVPDWAIRLKKNIFRNKE